MSFSLSVRSLRRRATPLLGLATVFILLVFPGQSFAQMRPLVREMLDNLRAIERITEGVALEDWDRIEDSARELRSRASSMRLLDLETLRMDRSQDAMWDGFLIAQEQAAREISLGVRNEDPVAVLAGTKKVMGNACLGCHGFFRDPQSRLRQSVLVMTSFLAYWQDINRGVMVRDFDLIKERANDLISLVKEVDTDEGLEENFGLGGPSQRRKFRRFLGAITSNASAIAGAAEAQDLTPILSSFNAMWLDGCVSCHKKFRH